MKDLKTKIIRPGMSVQEMVVIKMAHVEALEINKVNLKVSKEVKDRCIKNTTTDFNRNAIDYDNLGFYR
jgi:hypothetical protein